MYMYACVYLYIYIYTMYIYICTYIPLKSKDLALEGLSPKTCFSNKRHQKVSLAYTSKMTIFCPIGLQTGTRCSYMRQHVFSPVSARGPLGLQYYGKKETWTYIHISKVSSTIPHRPNKQSCTFYSRIFGINAEHTTTSSLGYLIPASTTFLCLSTTLFCVFPWLFDVVPRFVHGLSTGWSVAKKTLFCFCPSNRSHVQAQKTGVQRKKYISIPETTSGS